MENNKRYCISNKTCLVCSFGISLMNPQNQNFGFVFFIFFRHPKSFEKGKGSLFVQIFNLITNSSAFWPNFAFVTHSS